jgi:DNA-binding transcriptional LysR family regulator
MTLSKYQIFSAIIKAGSLTKAAEELHLTQSGVSYAISTLEQDLGFPLLKRDRSGIHLTTNGSRVLSHIEKVLHEENLLEQEAAAIRGVNIGSVRIGSISSVSMNWLPGVLIKFSQQFPNIDVSTRMACYDEITGWLNNNIVDIGFMSIPVSKPFEALPLKKDNLYVVLPPKHPLRNRKLISLTELVDEPFIMPLWGSDDNIRHMLLRYKAVPKNIKYEIMEEQTILALVAQSVGVTILPGLILNHVPDNVHVIELKEKESRTLGLVAITLKNTSPANVNFICCLLSYLRERGQLDFESEAALMEKYWRKR